MARIDTRIQRCIRLAGHLPSLYETLALYYGIYSSSYRGKEQKEKRGDATLEIEKIKGMAKANERWTRGEETQKAPPLLSDKL